MSGKSWVRFIPRATEAHHLREIFNGTKDRIHQERISRMFFKRINELLDSQIHPHTRRSLENLKEDIEEEIFKASPERKPRFEKMRPQFVEDKMIQVYTEKIDSSNILEALSRMRNEINMLERALIFSGDE